MQCLPTPLRGNCGVAQVQHSSNRPSKLRRVVSSARPGFRRQAGKDGDTSSTISSLDSLLGTLDSDMEETSSPDLASSARPEVEAPPQTGEGIKPLEAEATTATAIPQQAPASSVPQPPQLKQLLAQQAGIDPASNPSLSVLVKQLIGKWIQDQLKRPELVAATGHTHLPRVIPRLSYIMLALNLLVYGTGLGILFFEGFDNEQTYFFSLAKVNEAVAKGEYYRFLSSLFLHDSLSHLGVTLSSLYSVGTQIESALGYQAFLSVYLLSGLTGSVAAFALSSSITCGPSASLFGLIGALGAYMWKNRGLQRDSDQVFVILGASLIAIAWGAKSDTFVDNVGHIGGLLSGGLLSWGISPLYDPADIDMDNREMAAEKASKMRHKSLAERHKAEAEAAELAAKDLALDKTSIWAKLLLPVGYTSLFVGSVVLIIHDRIGHLPTAKWLPDLF
ncbi:hypothetical protein WJX74_005776 [Apatococcus lobatus]|uniref:Peptidase S54 rhomboid domain-containing protein n=1 Tax=Apatococcus lobatus TaxID=904363 RepID=A0AAW1SAI6_9CHLO